MQLHPLFLAPCTATKREHVLTSAPGSQAANLLMDSHGKLLLADFGLAQLSGCSKATGSSRSGGAGRQAEPSAHHGAGGCPQHSGSHMRISQELLRGSPCYMAPEMILEAQHR
jgi:serine/threonine protein kinase